MNEQTVGERCGDTVIYRMACVIFIDTFRMAEFQQHDIETEGTPHLLDQKDGLV